jgi:hypothetical protein
MEIKFAEVVRTSLEELATFAVDDVPLTGRYPPAPPLGEEPATYDFGPGKELTKRWWSRQRYSPWLDALLPPGASSDYPIQEGISDLLWARVLGRGASLARGEPPGRDFYHTLQALFLLRLVHVLPEYQKSCTSEIDAAVYRLGVLLRRQLQEELH